MLLEIRICSPASAIVVIAEYGVNTVCRLELAKNIHRWGDKNNFHIRKIPILHAIFPSAKFIFIVRDGRDVACSYQALANKQFQSIYAPKLPTEITSIAKEWCSNNRTAIDDLKQLGKQQVLRIRYEDLVRNPQGVLDEVCRFLELIFDIEMLNYYHHNRMAKQEPLDFLAWKAKTVQPLDTTSIGR